MLKKILNLPFVSILLIVIAVLLITNSWSVFNYPPKSVHQWRQSDCAAYVKTFYRTNSSLLEPATYNLAGKEGKVISELPIIYYIAAKLQHIVGEHYWVVRSLTFLCYFLGLLALYKIVRNWMSNSFFAITPIILLATAPYYYYYAINFLPNIPAISFSFIGLYCYLKHEEKSKLLYLILGTLAFILAVTLKPTDGGLIWLAYLGTKTGQSLFYKTKPNNIALLLGASVIIGLTMFGWTAYVNWYNDQNGNHQNLIGIYPIWDMDSGLRNYTFKRIATEWIDVFQQKWIVYLLLPLLIIYLIKWKRLHAFLKLFTLFLILGTLMYSILWFKAFTDHDYYQLPIVLPATFLGITMAEYFSRALKLNNSGLLKLGSYVFCAGLIAVSIYHNKNIQLERYTKPEFAHVNPAIYEAESYLLSIGIQPHNHVVCVPDKSPNISLNAINRYGYTEEFNSEYYNIENFMQQGASYLIISDSSYLNNPIYIPYMSKKVGEYKGVFVFDLRK